MARRSLFSIVFILLFAFISNAQVPRLVNYQGVLMDAEGNPVDSPLSIQFSIYDSATDGTELWTETQTVTIDDGLFNVLLGSVTPIPYSVFADSTTYLELKIDSDPAMIPRKRLVSVAYAFHAYEADQIGGKEASAFVQKITGVSPDQSGGINLAAGDNVTITPDNGNNKITISASGGGSSGDNLGNHTATSNIKLNGHWLSGDGTNEGIWISNSGRVGIATDNPASAYYLEVAGNAKINGFIEGTDDIYTANDIISMAGYIRAGFPSSTCGVRDIVADGNLYVHGTKSSTVQTLNYGSRCLYADEAAEVYFIDRGQGQLMNGEIMIEIDPVFQETVTIDENNPLLVRLHSQRIATVFLFPKKTQPISKLKN